MEQQSFISCVSWINRGFAAKVPIEMEPNEEEMQELKNNQMVVQQLQAENQMEEEIDQMDDDDMPVFGQNMNELAASKYPDVVDDMEDQEKQDYYIKDTDALIVAGKIQKENSSLEIYIYEQEKNNLYLHHEIMLSSFPLSIEWLNVSLGSISSNNPQKGNLAIVSTFLPEIQIWNLDLIDAVEPEMVLGGEIVNNKKKPKKFTNKAKKYKDGSHTDSVLSLSLNSGHRNILASGSADHTVKIWDLAQAKNIHTAAHHTARVNKVKWNPNQHSIMFTTSEDRNLAVLDSRYPDDRLLHQLPNKQQSIECACWNVNNQSQIIYGTNKGNAYLVDVRSIEKPILLAHAHPGAQITDIKTGQKNMMFTCSEDESVKVWTMNDLTNPLGLKKPKCGKMFCLDVMPGEAGPTLCCGNAKGQLFVWDITESKFIDSYWKS